MNEQNDSVRILTDIEIRQSPRWCRTTDYLGNLNRKTGFINSWSKKRNGWVQPFVNLINILKYRHQYDVVVSANIRTSQLFALCRRAFHLKRPRHIILELMLDEERTDLIWTAKKTLQKFIFSSVNIMFVSSRHEIKAYSERFGISKDHFRFLPFHTNVTEPRIISGSKNYILSAGRSGRDYATLAKAVDGLDQKFVVVSDRVSAEGVEFPVNVEVLFDIDHERYLDLLYNCNFVIVPLKKLVKSTGQVAILEAMALGKPVIATETTGTIDYIQSGVNGILVPVGDSEALKNAMKRVMNDQSLYKKLAVNALECVKKNHTFDVYVSRVLEAADELIKRPPLCEGIGTYRTVNLGRKN